MGLGYSKTSHKITKVAPMQNRREVHVSPHPASYGFNGNAKKGLSPLETMDKKGAVFEGQLPPLRETLHGRCSEVPRAISYDIMLESGETSIIKRHPPRRLQKLEPADLPTVLTSERLLKKQEAATTRKAEELDKKVQAAKQTTGIRQHLLKMQMLELNRKRQEIAQRNRLQSQAELKRCLQREARINKHKMRELKAQKVRENVQKNNDKEEFVTTEHDKSFNVDPGDTWNEGFIQQCYTPLYQPHKSSRLESWFMMHCADKDLFCDSSSDDSSDSWKREERRLQHKPVLIRTKTERIPVYDEFFDQEF
ncbi:uncharacterized protein CCDC198 [Rhinatrema bivittatum]|uniref:uncharacterized protein CCDC198 n=1 Tax=Rhinatrema bivittatum TaxID=194408 RepID=UPI0011289ED5|nr:uncharacterized protein CCDC198 [Rhinatrema bivittatum]XP_029454097.1 uncharacterized protein CCDC198 [Rhinatrema bivittatum]